MQEERILEVGLDELGRVFVKPSQTVFDAIFRTCMGVHWDASKRHLRGQKPDEWTPARWFQQILMAAISEYGVWLRLAPGTTWVNVPDDVRREIGDFVQSNRLQTALEERRTASQEQSERGVLERAIARAEVLWNEKQFEKCVELLSPYQSRLSPAQLKRFEIAQRRITD